MRTLVKVVACLVRSGSELLVFDHPTAGTQIPKGTVEAGESLEEAGLRELWEETGVASARAVRDLGRRVRIARGEPFETGPWERHEWRHLLAEPTTGLPERWDHVAIGSIDEEGLVFRCRWVAVDVRPPEGLHPAFWDAWLRVVGALR